MPLVRYEGQRDMLYNQTFNLDQVQFAAEGIKDAQQTVCIQDLRISLWSIPFIKLFSCNHLYDTLFWFVQEYADGFIHNS